MNHQVFSSQIAIHKATQHFAQSDWNDCTYMWLYTCTGHMNAIGVDAKLGDPWSCFMTQASRGCTANSGIQVLGRKRMAADSRVLNEAT